MRLVVTPASDVVGLGDTARRRFTGGGPGRASHATLSV